MDQNVPGNFDDYSHGTHVGSIAGGRRYGIAKAVRFFFLFLKKKYKILILF